MAGHYALRLSLESVVGTSCYGKILHSGKGVSEEGTPMSTEQQKALVRRYYQAWSPRALEVHEKSVLPPTSIIIGQPGKEQALKASQTSFGQ
jgi:hypothetical protein